MKRERTAQVAKDPIENGSMNCWIIHAQENVAEARSKQARREWRANTLAEYLADRGHEVVRWRSAFSHQSKVMLREDSCREPIDNYSIQYIASTEYKKHIGWRRVRNHRKLGSNFSRLAEAYSDYPDLIHVCNVPIELCYSAVKFGKEHGIPVVIDIRDLWPDVYVDFIPHQLAFLRKPTQLYFDRFSSKLSYAFSNATAITALTKSYLQWGLQKAKRSQTDKDAVFPMCYQRLDDKLQGSQLSKLQKKLGLDADSIVACYIGNIGFQSDFETVIEAARILAEEFPMLKFVLAGNGPRIEPLRALASGLPNVILPGWLEAPEIHGLMQLSSFGLIAYKSVKNFTLNVPNKFPEYCAGGLAIACAIEGEMGTLVRETKCGFMYDEGSSKSLATEFARVMKDPAQIAVMSAAATNLHRTRFDGANIFPQFTEHLERLVTICK